MYEWFGFPSIYVKTILTTNRKAAALHVSFHDLPMKEECVRDMGESHVERGQYELCIYVKLLNNKFN